jgi:serine/threonine-protein kinase RsbT
MEPRETRFSIQNETDVARAVLLTGRFCVECGLDKIRSQMMSTAVSELARNIVKYGMRGRVIVRSVVRGALTGVEACAEDEGPGITDVDQALEDHFSTSGTLGLGLPGIKRMMDEFEIESAPGRGTRVTIRKWR